MGVSGCGKSSLGFALAAALGWRFVEGDTLHPQQNIAKMAAGVALNDADRWPFLQQVAHVIVTAPNPGIVVTCSALKRAYRDYIRAAAGEVTFVLPTLNVAQLRARLTQRQNHFMPPSLLESQIADLQMPGADERVICIDGTLSTADQVAYVLQAKQCWVPTLSHDVGGD
jgi:gluconokinase